ncbi:hypothetical protein [Microbacterium sp. NPDC058345]|uniref:alpha-L-rhamnosidase-related protein n=1 Tax=Microbacterium sp. NPDC058345 TaxID=3346455 RepID=UPI00366953B2
MDDGVQQSIAPRSIEETLDAARRHSPDPFPDDVAAATDRTWYYLPGEYEAGALHRIVRESDAVARYSEYATNYRQPGEELRLELGLRPSDEPVRLAVHGRLELVSATVADTLIDGESLIVTAPDGGTVTLRISPLPGAPAALAVPDGAPLRGPMLARSAEGRSVLLQSRRGNAVPPHLAPEPVVKLRLLDADGLLEAPAEILARPVVTVASAPMLATGESREEALVARGSDQEDDHEVVGEGPGRWTTRHPVAMRYLHVDRPVDEASALAHIRPIRHRGAFVCSDERLSRIWAVSAYTLRLCMQTLVVDGLKRDRMPWVGDQAISALANAFAFGDGEIARDSHLALGRPTHGYVNGISDYSLWWVITADILKEYFPRPDDPLPDLTEDFVARLLAQADADGLFAPSMTHDGFTATNDGSVLIDWGYETPPGEVSTALQMLWVWALSCAGRTATGESADRLARTRAQAMSSLHARAWDVEAGAWRACVDGVSAPDSYANFLAVAAGITDLAEEPGVLAAFERQRGRTPYMQTVLLRAMLAGGQQSAVLDRIRRDWGEMLTPESTTFWEEFPTPGESSYAMYGRRFARSLCHAWGAGPAALLPEAVFGLRPSVPGWRRFEVSLGEVALEWAAAVVPSDHGPIGIRKVGDLLELDIPEGCVAVVQGQELTSGTHRVTQAH